MRLTTCTTAIIAALFTSATSAAPMPEDVGLLAPARIVERWNPITGGPYCQLPGKKKTHPWWCHGAK